MKESLRKSFQSELMWITRSKDRVKRVHSNMLQQDIQAKRGAPLCYIQHLFG